MSLQGQEILLVEGRGCSRVHVVAGDDRVGAGTFHIKGQCWDSIPFKVTDERDSQGRLIVRTDQPAIGPVDGPYSPLYLPYGWQPPAGKRRR